MQNCGRRFGQLQIVRAAETKTLFPSPDGKIAHALALILACATATDASVNFSMYVPQRPSKCPIAPMGISHVLRLCLQGGGVYIFGTVTFLSCTVSGNTAYNVHAHAQTSHRPDGIFTCFALCACRAAVFTPVARRASHRAPSMATQLLMCVLILKSSHRFADRIDFRHLPGIQSCPTSLALQNAPMG